MRTFGFVCLGLLLTKSRAFQPGPIQRSKRLFRASSFANPRFEKALSSRQQPGWFPKLPSVDTKPIWDKLTTFPKFEQSLSSRQPASWSLPKLPPIPSIRIDTKPIWDKLTSPVIIDTGTSAPLFFFIMVLAPLMLMGGMERSGDLFRVARSLLTEMDEIAPVGPAAEVHAEILLDLSHVALDFSTIAKGPTSAVAVRLLVFLGRICVLMADYLPDHSIHMDELAFQLLFLHMAWTNLLKSLHFVSVGFVASSRKMSLPDGRAFRLLFQPAGLTWNQYKAFSSKAVDWITLREQEVIELSANPAPGYLYWLYKGNVTVQEQQGEEIISNYAISRASPAEEGIGKGLLGDLALLDFLDGGASTTQQQQNANVPDTKVIGGLGGATMLRIDAALLMKWIREYDENVEQPLRNLLLRGIREKLRP